MPTTTATAPPDARMHAAPHGGPPGPVPDTQRHNLLRWGAWPGFAAIYSGALWVGFRMATAPDALSPVWPATGVAIAGLCLLGRRAWPIVAAMAFAAQLPGLGATGAALASIGATFEAILGAWILSWAGADGAFRTSRGVGRFLVVAVAAPVPGALFGTFAVASAGTAGLLPVAATGYLGHAVGALLVVPAIVLVRRRNLPQVRPAEAVAFSLVAVAGVLLAFYPWRPASLTEIRLGFVVIVPMVWAAARMGPLISAWLAVAIAGAAHWGLRAGTITLFGSPMAVLLQLDALIGLVSLLALILAATVQQRNDMIRLLRDNERRLEDAVERLRRSGQQKARFLQKASHEMRTPLTPLVMQVHLLRTDPTIMAGHGHAIDTIDSNTKRLARLVDAMLTAATAQSAGPGNRVASTVAAILAETREKHAATAERRGIGLQATGDDARVSVDRVAVHRILEALVGNAVRHSPEGGLVSIEANVDGHDLVLHVNDQGPGIAHEDRERLFEPFYEPTEVRTDAGVGLDLFIARTIAEGIDGTLSLDDTPSGASFRLRLPDAVVD